MNFRIKKGLDLPITGMVKNHKINEKVVSRVALLGADFNGMKPSFMVKEGDLVRAGQLLFTCKKNEGLRFCAKHSGTIEQINRGPKRAFYSIVIRLNSSNNPVDFESFQNIDEGSLTRESVSKVLIESGEWACLRQRPFENVAKVGATPHSLFITATDTQPLALDPTQIIGLYKREFEKGLEVLSLLPSKKTYLCTAKEMNLETPKNCQVVLFTGPHPSGNVGTHMHFLLPVNAVRFNWHVGYQDVIAIGHLFLTGRLFSKRLISLAGPEVKDPKVIRTERGACVSEVVAGEVLGETIRVISGSVLSGRIARDGFDYLGHFHQQISIIKEDQRREFLGWQTPGLEKFSTRKVFLSSLFPKKKFNFGSSTHGSKRAMVPIGMFEDVMPLDILPTQLLRAIVTGDLELAQDLGCLELAEEDLALCTFVSPGKVDFGPHLRKTLNAIEKEG